MFFSSWIENLTIIRPTNIFGKSQMKSHAKFWESHVIPDLLTKIAEAQDAIEVFWDGSQIRNFIHVDDINEFLLQILSLEWQYFFNLRSDILLSIGELAHELIEFSRKQVKIKFLPEFMKYEQMKICNFNTSYIESFGFRKVVDSIGSWLLK